MSSERDAVLAIESWWQQHRTRVAMSLDQDFAEGWAAGPLKTLATDLSNSSLPSPSGRRRRLSSDGFDRGLSPLMWGPSDDDLSVFEVDDLSSVCDSGFCGSSCNNSSFNSNNTGVLSNASSLSSIYDAFRSEKELSRLVSSPPPDTAVPPDELASQRTRRKKRQWPVKLVPCAILQEDPHLGTTSKYRAFNLLSDSGNDKADCIWALHTGAVHQGFVLDCGRECKVATVRLKNTGNNEFSFERGTREFSIEVSRDNIDWEHVASGCLESCRGLDATERLQLANGTRHLKWHTERFRPRLMRYLRFTVRSFYGKGAGLNSFQVVKSTSNMATRPSHTRIDTLTELERYEFFMNTFLDTLKPLQLDRNCSVFYRAVHVLHNHIVNATHLLLQGCSLDMTSGKSGRSLIEFFRTLLCEEVRREGLTLESEAGSQIIFEGSSVIRDLLIRFSRNRPFHSVNDEDEAYDFLEAEDSKRSQIPPSVSNPLGHSFVGAEFDLPVHCAVCQGLLWMLEPGYRCSSCNVSCHPCCQAHVTIECSQMRPAPGKPIIEPTGSFGLPLSMLERPLPEIMERCIETLEQEHLHRAGLYRKAPSPAAYAALKHQVSDGNLDAIDTADCHCIAALLKNFYSSLPEPVIPYRVFWSLLGLVGDGSSEISPDQQDAIYRVLNSLPDLNAKCLQATIHHLALTARTQGFELTVRTLGIIFGPLLLPSPPTISALASVRVAMQQAKLVECLISNHLDRLGQCYQDVSALSVLADQVASDPSQTTCYRSFTVMPVNGEDTYSTLQLLRDALIADAATLGAYYPSELAAAIRRELFIPETIQGPTLEELFGTMPLLLDTEEIPVSNDWCDEVTACCKELKRLSCHYSREWRPTSWTELLPAVSEESRPKRLIKTKTKPVVYIPPALHDGPLGLDILLTSLRQQTSAAESPKLPVRRDSVYSPVTKAPPAFASIARKDLQTMVKPQAVLPSASRTPAVQVGPRIAQQHLVQAPEAIYSPPQFRARAVSSPALLKKPSVYTGPKPPPQFKVERARSSSTGQLSSMRPRTAHRPRDLPRSPLASSATPARQVSRLSRTNSRLAPAASDETGVVELDV